MSAKRARDADGDDGDSKRIRSNTGSPVPAASDADQARQQIAARMAAMKAKIAAAKPANDKEAQKNEAMRKIAEFKERAAAQRPQSDLQARIAEVRARAAALAKQRETPPPEPPRQEGRVARGGLGIGLHPSLMGGQASKPQKAEPVNKVNPYLPADEEVEVRERKSKALSFAPHGKYIAQAAALKQQAKLEEMKRRVAMESRKVQIEEASDKSFLVPEPPEVEWWDENLLRGKTYDGEDRIESADSVITAYVQHPVLLVPPQDKFMPAPKPLMLTHKEQKKLRRQRRMADMKEEQAKVRLGLQEPAPPKVKQSNMMRVYAEQAVKDPTAVEARVKGEIAQRKTDHDRSNEERKLGKEERAEKLKQQQAADVARGIKIAVFRVDSLSSGKHRYLVDVNAKQNELTGVVVLHADMNLVVVEGGAHSVNNYKKLMLNRIKWTENTLLMSSNNNSTFVAAAARSTTRDFEEGPSAIDTWLNPLTERGELKDLSENKCLLVWEGDERQRAFRKWGSRVCNTDGEARDMLARSKMENMWTLAKGMA